MRRSHRTNNTIWMIRTSHVYHMTDIAFHVRVCSKYDCAALVATINLILCTHTIRTDDKKSDDGTTIQRRRRLFRQEEKNTTQKIGDLSCFLCFFSGVFCTFFLGYLFTNFGRCYRFAFARTLLFSISNDITMAMTMVNTAELPNGRTQIQRKYLWMQKLR